MAHCGAVALKKNVRVKLFNSLTCTLLTVQCQNIVKGEKKVKHHVRNMNGSI